ncbi:MAG TPA: hypothetical protein VNN55_02920 [bacterium]|nr:hypothetical protein [bacterium]
MNGQLKVLLGTDTTLGFIHTLLGPDHYLPFVALAKTKGWSARKTMVITILCGLGHVLGSIVLGMLGVGLGWALGSIERFEAWHGEWAAWALIGFGLVYLAWGVRQGIHNHPHTHRHVHPDGTIHSHVHGYQSARAHVHEGASGAPVMPWILFIIFVLGPCEPLSPVLMAPAAAHRWGGVVLVAAVFGAVIIATMCAMAWAILYGLGLLRVQQLSRWAHALAGFSLFACGGAIQWLGL